MTGKEYLRELRSMDVELASIRDQIERLRMLAEGLQAVQIRDMPGGGIKLDTADRVAQLVDEQTKYNELHDIFIDMRHEAETYIERVDGHDNRAVLRYRYLSNRTWEEVAEAMGYSVSQVHRIHCDAIACFDRNLRQSGIDLDNTMR